MRWALHRGGTLQAGHELITAELPQTLTPFVESWCGYREWSPGRVERRESPLGRAVLIFECGPPLAVGRPEGKLTRHRAGFFAAIDDAPSLTAFENGQEGIQLNLTPRGAYALIGARTRELARHVVGLLDLRFGSEVADELRATTDWGRRFEKVRCFLVERLSRARELSPVVRWALERIDRSHGAVRIDALSDELGFTRKHLHRRFVDELGFAPKRYAALRRFEHVTSLLRADRAGSLAQLAADVGYADQAHLAREVRRFSGLSSTGLARSFDDPLSRALYTLTSLE